MSYPVGTICIGQNIKLPLDRNGMECVVIEPIRRITNRMDLFGRRMDPADEYKVRWADGLEFNSQPYMLRRKDWDDEDKRAEDRQKVSKLIAACKKAAESAIEAGEKV